MIVFYYFKKFFKKFYNHIYKFHIKILDNLDAHLYFTDFAIFISLYYFFNHLVI